MNEKLNKKKNELQKLENQLKVLQEKIKAIKTEINEMEIFEIRKAMESSNTTIEEILDLLKNKN